MSEQTTVSADVNSESQVSGDIDAQLNEMQTSEGKSETQVEQKTEVQEQQPQDSGEKAPKVVPLAALHEERRERQRLQQELSAQRAMMERVNQRLEVLTTPRQQAPDPAADPVAYLDHRFKQLEQTVQPVLQSQQQAAQEQQRQAVVQHLTAQVQMASAEFAKEKPDLPEAGKHLNETRARELMVMGVPEMQAWAQADQELHNALLQWAHQGMNPARMAYELAQARGYQPKSAQSQMQTAEQKIASQQKGTQAAKSLGNGGAVTQGKLTAEALANMSDEDFAKLTDAQFRQAMGG